MTSDAPPKTPEPQEVPARRRKLYRAAPYIFGVVLASIYGFGLSHLEPPASVKDLLSAVLNVAAIAVGFLSTAKSILFSIENKKAIKQFKQSGRWETLLKTMLAAVHWSMSLAAMSGVCLLVFEPGPGKWWWMPRVALIAWVWVMGTAAGLYVHVVRTLSVVLSQD